MLELVVCDMAGTTILDNDFVAEAFVGAFREHGLVITAAQTAPLMGLRKPLAIESALKSLGLNGDVEAIHDHFLKGMIDFYQSSPEFGPMPGAEEFFAECKQRGVKVGLDTGFSRPIADAILDRLNWRDVVDATVTSDEVDEGRPAPDMIFELMDKTFVKNVGGVAKIGDTVSDMRQGIAARCSSVVGVLSGTDGETQLRAAGATQIIPSIATAWTVLS